MIKCWKKIRHDKQFSFELGKHSPLAMDRNERRYKIINCFTRRLDGVVFKSCSITLMSFLFPVCRYKGKKGTHLQNFLNTPKKINKTSGKKVKPHYFFYTF